MYKAKQKLPLNIQRLFSVDEVAYYTTRQLKNMTEVYIRTPLKSKCISICGVKKDIRNSTTLHRFVERVQEKVVTELRFIKLITF